MSDQVYWPHHGGRDKPLVWIAGEIRTPPFSRSARVEAGALLRRLQRGEVLELPHSRPMPIIGKRCHELRIPDAAVDWRIVHRLDSDAVIILAVFAKKTQRTPKSVVRVCRARLQAYDQAGG